MNARMAMPIMIGCIIAGYTPASSAHHAATMFDRDRAIELSGDQVTIHAAPTRNGAPAALFIGARLADGSTLGRFEEPAGT